MFSRRMFLGAALCAPAVLRATPVQRVIVVGAGAAGITAAFELRRAGVEVTVLEAAPRWGGRIERLRGFADFPIDLGAEWIHSAPDVLDQIARRPVTLETLRYQPRTYQVWTNGRLVDRNDLHRDYAEVKFTRSTWYGFFERYLWPDIAAHVRLNTAVEVIDYRGSGVRVTALGQSLEADRVIVTVPVSVLQDGDIRFVPALPRRMRRGLGDVTFGHGFKAFLRFRQRFYPDILLGAPNAFETDTWEDKTYYDAAFGKGADSHVLGLFSTREASYRRARMTEADLLADILAELDAIYDGAASRSYIAGKARLWSQDRFIRGTYSMEYEGGDYDSKADIFAPLDGRVFFAGEAADRSGESTVHGAALSARSTVAAILAG